MKKAKKQMRWIATLAVLLVTGCAPAYRTYSGCNIDCQYCEPPPLPYTYYEGCACHSQSVSNYIEYQPQLVEVKRRDGINNDTAKE
ncbi:hypothetical protein [uncultured Gimesia sp.]|uniref:hypothetical protein n=1 Tax=uncultured Gimesia sp. TaxID=1678688 RepID=UPI0030D91AB9|tara:strand:+ start:14933 stop:15190 length:258 start_codon:yes stop_codon:yes gene_type:complete